MKIRFFGSSQCRDCLEVFVLLNKYQIDYEYIDALEEDDDIQELCDQYEVDELPHVQWVDDEGTIIVESAGPIEEEDFVGYLSDYFPNY